MLMYKLMIAILIFGHPLTTLGVYKGLEAPDFKIEISTTHL